jgi:hypothetical protein
VKPDEWIRERRQVATLWILFCAMVLVAVGLDQLRPPGGWIALEFPAWTQPSSTPIAGWTQENRETVLFGLGLDFLFLVLYPLFLSLLCARAARHWRLPARLASAARISSRLVLVAAPLDALENIGLFLLITGDTSASLRWFITAVSAPKWLIALAAALVGLICLIWRLLRRQRGSG